jgi:hypothetical protein
MFDLIIRFDRQHPVLSGWLVGIGLAANVSICIILAVREVIR